MNANSSLDGFAAAGGPQWRDSVRFSILDTEFGDGSAFIKAWSTWRANPGACVRLEYIALCENPPSKPPPELAAFWPLHVSGYHRIQTGSDGLHLTLIFEKNAETSLENLSALFDAIFLRRPLASASNLARLSRPGTTIEALFRDALTEHALERSGFSIATDSHKIVGSYFRQNSRSRVSARDFSEKKAIVIGAGLAGTAAGASLATRGWDVTLIDRQPLPGQGASGNRAAVFSPMLSRDDAHAARLSRACFLDLIQELRKLESLGHPVRWSSCGVLQMARTTKEEDNLKASVEAADFPTAYVRLLGKEEAQDDVGHFLLSGGLLFPGGGWLTPSSLCLARMHCHGLRFLAGAAVLRIRRVNDLWHVFGAEDKLLASAPVLVCANAFEAALFPQAMGLHLKKVRGQVTHIPESLLPKFNRVLRRDGYLTPPDEGICSLGATYDFGSDDHELSEGGHADNLGTLPSLLAGVSIDLSSARLSGRVGFRSLTADRLPMIGAIPDFGIPAESGLTLKDVARHPGLYALLGMGSRGAVWSTLAGEALAAQINGDSAPLPLDLTHAVDPARFLLKSVHTRTRVTRTQRENSPPSPITPPSLT